MKPQSGFPIHQILDMGQKLEFSLFDIRLPPQQLANFRQGHHGHHQGIIPKLLIIFFMNDDMLDTALFRTWHFVHYPFSPALKERQPGRIACLFITVGQR